MQIGCISETLDQAWIVPAFDGHLFFSPSQKIPLAWSMCAASRSVLESMIALDRIRWCVGRDWEDRVDLNCYQGFSKMEWCLCWEDVRNISTRSRLSTPD